MLETGRVLNHYEIVRLLGKGGMGEVYLARDRKLGREVALKVLPAELVANQERRERFEREARSVAALQHPNIVTLHSIEDAEGMIFLVMELIGGKPLSEVIPRGGLPLDRFLEIAIPLADAVAAAHARGITHRDLKPDNVLIDEQGRAQILDFGLAKVTEPVGLGAASLEPTEALTGEGKIVGTIAYMSPEQVEAREVDARSDIFSLGVMLYEMATGARPFDGDTSMSVLTSILRDEPRLVTERNQRLPRYLGRIVKRCLQKDPSRRFQSALDLRNDLVELKEELASGELPSPATAQATGAGAKRRWLPIALGLALLALGGLWLTSRLGGGDPNGVAASSHQIRRLTVQGSPGGVAISPDGRYVTYWSQGVGRWVLRLQQIATGSDVEVVPAFEWNASGERLAFSPDGEYIRYLTGTGGRARTLWEVPVLGGSPRKLVEGVLVGLAFSPDGTQVTFVPGTDFNDRWKRLDLVSLADGARRRVFELPEGGSDIEVVAWSPDGSRIAIAIGDASGDHLTILPVEGGEAVPVPTSQFFAINDVCWSPSGDQLLVLAAGRGGQTTIQPWLVNPKSGARRQLIHDFNSYDGCSTTADGATIATTRNEVQSQIWVVPLDRPGDAQAIPTTTGRSDGSGRFGWLDDQTLVYTAPDGATWNIWRVAAEGGTSVRLTQKGASEPAVSHGGPIVFESGWEIEGRQGVYTIDRDGGGLRRLSPEGLFADRPTATPDGKWLFYELLEGERLNYVRTPFEGGEPRVVTEYTCHLASISPDGSLMALHELNPEVDRWQTAIYPTDLSAPPRYLDFHSESYSPWAGADALYISRSVDGVANIHRVDLEDLSEEQVTFFADGQIFAFDVSPDLARLAVGRGEAVNDLLLIDGLLGSATGTAE